MLLTYKYVKHNPYGYQEGRWGGMKWEIGTDIHTMLCIKQIMRTYCIAQGTLLGALWWPKWEGNPKKRGCMYRYGWFTLLYSRNWQQCKATILQFLKRHLKLKRTMINNFSSQSHLFHLSLSSYHFHLSLFFTLVE